MAQHGGKSSQHHNAKKRSSDFGSSGQQKRQRTQNGLSTDSLRSDAGKMKSDNTSQVHDGTSNFGSVDPSIVASIKLRGPGETRTPPPEVPAALDPKAHLVPPEADNTEIRKSFEIDAIAIRHNSTIKSGVIRAIATLYAEPKQDKRVIIALMAKADSANTCITIAEILKRQIQADGKRWFQYTGSWSRLENIPTPSKRPQRRHGDTVDQQDQEPEVHVEAEDGFEVLERVDRQKVRSIACLVIYVALESIAPLRAIYSEQSCPASKPG